MGYVNNSPTKKIWIPLEYDWIIQNANGGSMSEFNEKYKKRYGIDLTEIVKLDTDLIIISGDVSSYIIPDSNYKVSFVDNSPWYTEKAYSAQEKSDATTTIIAEDKNSRTGFGISFVISADSPFNYDNITVHSHEI